METHKILILGGTGRTGRYVVSDALKRGYQVRGLTRNISKAPSFKDGKIEWIQGDIYNQETLEKAAEGCTVIISVLGPDNLKKTTIYTDAATKLLGIARKTNIKRLFFLSADLKNPKAGFYWKNVLTCFIKDQLKNIADAEDIIANPQNNDLEWTVLRPFNFSVEDASDLVLYEENHVTGRFNDKTTLGDMSKFIMDEIRNRAWIHKFVSIAHRENQCCSIF